MLVASLKLCVPSVKERKKNRIKADSIKEGLQQNFSVLVPSTKIALDRCWEKKLLINLAHRCPCLDLQFYSQFFINT